MKQIPDFNCLNIGTSIYALSGRQIFMFKKYKFSLETAPNTKISAIAEHLILFTKPKWNMLASCLKFVFNKIFWNIT